MFGETDCNRDLNPLRKRTKKTPNHGRGERQIEGLVVEAIQTGGAGLQEKLNASNRARQHNRYLKYCYRLYRCYYHWYLKYCHRLRCWYLQHSYRLLTRILVRLIIQTRKRAIWRRNRPNSDSIQSKKPSSKRPRTPQSAPKS